MKTVVVLSLSFVCLAAAPALSADDRVHFNRDIRPILADVCFQCHGPDPGSRKGDLRLDREGHYFGADHEAIVTKGRPDASPLYERITSTDPDTVMPPPKSKKQLTAAQKELIRRWIAEGAEWQPHWSYIAPERPKLPDVKNGAWIRNPIDRFILARLEAARLAPAAEADPAALARRLYLDLTGLPPTPADVDAFVAAYVRPDGSKNEQAYTALVDKLFESPRYGEHRARYWLDAARYADTHGLHFDNYREMWPYRDWVVRAFQRNQPFDQFTVEQLAGDLLPNATLEQRVATGFHRCNITTNEGGTIADENLAHYARDRVETTAWVWLGLTSNCCVCHDHKFDPFTMREFYSMSAFFRNTTQGSHDGNIKDTKPILFIPQPDDAARYTAIDGELAAARDSLNQRRAAAGAAIDEWLKTVQPGDVDLDAAQLVLHAPLTEGAGNDVKLKRLAQADEPGLADATVAAQGTLGWRTDGKLGPAAVFAAESSLVLGDVGNFDRHEAFAVALWVRPAENLNDGLLACRLAESGGNQGWELALFQGGKLNFALHSAQPKQTIRAVTRNSVAKPGQWVHLAAVYDGSGKVDGLQLFVNGAPADANKQGTVVDGSLRTTSELLAGQRGKKASHFTGGAMQDLRLYGRRLSLAEVRTLSQLPELRADAAAGPNRNKSRLTTFFLEHRDPAYQESTRRVAKLEDEQRALQARASITHVQEEKMNSPAMANILMRGQYDKLGDKVTPDVFSALNPFPDDAPRNRLGLARWLLDKQNPLSARVTVNRFWQEVFGTGIVKTAEDFGIMGDPPSHQELLDWLAVEFRESGWDVRHLFRLILTSATYRQSSAATPEKLTKDRDNRLLSRGPRFRLDAEMLRDYVLSASGTLSSKMGGPSTRPYQPEGIWDVVGLPGGNTRDYKQDTGENLYRRSLYTFWKRMAPPPNMETFNAPSREFSCLRRERTNTPLQALVTLNDPQFVEASRRLAQSVLKEAPDADARATLQSAARRVLCRPLKDAELRVLEPAVGEFARYYAEHMADAQALVKVGDSPADATLDAAKLATWTNVCNALFNLDEALNK